MTLRHGRFDTALGELLLVADGDALTGVYFEQHRYPPEPDAIGDDLGRDPEAPSADAASTGSAADGAEPDGAELDDAHPDSATTDEAGAALRADPVLAEAARQLREYLAGERRAFDLELAPSGDPMSQEVWRMLCEIPFGETTSYGALAERLGSRGLAQRVGQAVGHNPVSIVIPCHRVLGADGSLTGYAGGLERKRFLLALEEPPAVDAGRLF